MLLTSVKLSHLCLFKGFFCNAKVQVIKDIVVSSGMYNIESIFGHCFEEAI